MDDTVKQILDFFQRDDIHEYPREMLDLALQHEADLVPHLIKLFEEVLDEPECFTVEPAYLKYAFAINLLAHWRRQDAYDTILKVMALPRDVLDSLFGDMITEDFPRILYQTCGGRYEPITQLVQNREADEYVRGSAMEALVIGALMGDLPRSEALDFLGNLFTGAEAEPDSHFWDAAATCMSDLYPEGYMETIEGAYERELIWPGYIDLESFKRVLAQDRDELLKETKEKVRWRLKEDFHDYMSWWACFHEDSDSRYDTGFPAPEPGRSAAERQEKKHKKAKKKMAKASKRKNRRR
jgi:Protein of unknown function (DUF1186)